MSKSVVFGNMASIALHACAEFPEYSLGKQDVSAVVSVVAAAPDVATDSRTPVDLLLVLDVSGSMQQTLPLVKRTAQYIVKRASSCDRIGVVAYNRDAKVIFALEDMSAMAKLRATAAVESLSAEADTNIADALLVSASLAKDAIASAASFSKKPSSGDAPLTLHLDERARVTAVLLLTDGEATTGVMKPEGLEALAKTLPEQCVLHTFGYGDDHDTALLKNLAKIGHGNYYYIKSDDEVAAAFGNCLGGLMSTVAQNIRLTLHTPGIHSVAASVKTPFPVTKGHDGSATISLSDLQHEERRDVLVGVTIAALPVGDGENASRLVEILQCEVAYFDVAGSQMASSEVTLAIRRCATVTDKTRNPLIDEQRNRMLFLEASDRIKVLADKGSLDKARGVVDETIAKMRGAPSALSAMTLNLISCLQHIRDGLRDRDTYVAKGINEMASLSNVHASQRSTGFDIGSEAYATSNKVQSQFEYVNEIACNVALPDSGDDDDYEPPRKRARTDLTEPNEEVQQSQLF